MTERAFRPITPRRQCFLSKLKVVDLMIQIDRGAKIEYYKQHFQQNYNSVEGYFLDKDNSQIMLTFKDYFLDVFYPLGYEEIRAMLRNIFPEKESRNYYQGGKM